MAVKKMSGEKRSTKLSIAEIVALILITWFAFVWGWITRDFALGKYWVATGTFLPWFWLLLVVGYLGKKGVLRLSKEFVVCVIFILMMTTGKWYWFMGTSEVNIFNNFAATYTSAAQAWIEIPVAREYLAGLLPTWLVPQDDVAVGRYYSGGGDPYWGVYIGPITAWSLLLISIVLISAPMVLLILGPQWYEVERLQFPIVIPSVYAVNETFPTEEKGEWFRIANFTTGRYKVFWIAFVIGLFLNLPYILTQVIPAMPVFPIMGGGYGVWNLEGLDAAVENILPNAQLDCQVVVTNILIFTMLPLDVTITALIFRVFVGVIYNPLVTRMGLVAPGDNFAPGLAWPWPHFLGFAYMGGFMGMAAMALWSTRDRWFRAFKSFKEDFEVEGASMRLGMILMAIGALLMLGVWIAAGLNPVMAVIWLVLFTMMNIGGAYLYAGGMWYGADCHGLYTWQLGFPIGQGLGIWSGTAPQQNASLAVYGLASGTMGHCISPFGSNSAFSFSQFTATYGLAKGTNADFKKVVTYLVIALVFLFPFALTVNTYVASHVGMANTGEQTWSTAAGALDTGVRGISFGIGDLSFTDMWTWTIGGGAIFVIISWLRTIFPWFFINPIGISLALGAGLWLVGWVNPLVAIILRVTLEKTMGPRRTMEYLIPILSGLAIGMGFLYFFVGLYIMATSSLPTFAALWQ